MCIATIRPTWSKHSSHVNISQTESKHSTHTQNGTGTTKHGNNNTSRAVNTIDSVEEELKDLHTLVLCDALPL